MSAASARWIAKLARAFGCTMAEVRAMPLRDINAMQEVLILEDRARRRAERTKRGRR